MTFWQLLLESWECLLLFALLFGGSVFAWVEHQLALHRKHQEKIAQLKLDTVREENKRVERQAHRRPDPEHSSMQGYEGASQALEMDISSHEE